MLLKGLLQLLPAHVVSSRGLMPLCGFVGFGELSMSSWVDWSHHILSLPLPPIVMPPAHCAAWRTMCHVANMSRRTFAGVWLGWATCVWGGGLGLDVAMCVCFRQRAASLRGGACVFICWCQQVFLLVAGYSMHMSRGLYNRYTALWCAARPCWGVCATICQHDGWL